LSETQLWECEREEHCTDQWVHVMIMCDANAQGYAKCEDICQLLYSVKVFSEFESKAACLCLWLSLSLHCRSLASHSSSVSASRLCLALSLHHTSFSVPPISYSARAMCKKVCSPPHTSGSTSYIWSKFTQMSTHQVSRDGIGHLRILCWFECAEMVEHII